MPSVGSLQRNKTGYLFTPEVTIVQETAVDHSGTRSKECQTLLQSPIQVNPTLGLHTDSTPSADPSLHTQDMNTGSNPNLSQGHPIDELTNVPIDTNSRANQLLLPNSNNSSSEFGPFVSGFVDESRQRSNSFNTNMLRGGGQVGAVTNHPMSTSVVDPLRRFNASQTLTKTSSVDNVLNPIPQEVPTQLRHSHTVAEIPPHALSNDSGYHTPPNRQHGHTSPPWPANMQVQWPAHVSPPGGIMPPPQYFHSGRPITAAHRSSAPLPVSQNLTIDTGDPSGHYQPEPSTPQIVIGNPMSYSQPASLQPPPYMTPTFSRGHDPFTSLPQPQGGTRHDPYASLPPSQGGTPKTPEEVNICSYQQDRKQRLVNKFRSEEVELAELKQEVENLMKLIELESQANQGVDNQMEQEVMSMANENKKLALELQRLTQRVPCMNPAIPAHTTVPPPVPQARTGMTTPTSVYPATTPHSTLPYTGSNTMINNTTTSSLRPGRTPPPIPPRRSPTRQIEEEEWSCSECTFLNHPLIASCEMCQTARQVQSRPGSNVL